jgi:hypothetical protein
MARLLSRIIGSTDPSPAVADKNVGVFETNSRRFDVGKAAFEASRPIFRAR